MGPTWASTTRWARLEAAMEPVRLELLEQLAETPFADRIELAALSAARSRRSFAAWRRSPRRAWSRIWGTRRSCCPARGGSL